MACVQWNPQNSDYGSEFDGSIEPGIADNVALATIEQFICLCQMPLAPIPHAVTDM